MVRARRFMALPAVVAFLALASSASADTVQVTTNLDTLEGVNGCTLRDAAAAMTTGATANACTYVTAAGTDTITFAPSVSGTITLGSAGAVTLSDPRRAMNVVGPGVGNLTVTEGVADRVFTETGANPVTVSGMTITGGNPPAETVLGGCIFNDGALTVSHVRVTGCTASTNGGPLGTDADGAAIGSTGTLTVSDSLVDGNHSIATGTADGRLVTARGAINIQGTGSLTIDNSTITNNDATATNHFTGAGVEAQAFAGVVATGAGLSFSISHSTISDNRATGIVDAGNSFTAGGVFLFATGAGTKTIELSTIVGNKADSTGTATTVAAGGVYNQGTAVIRSSTIAQNGPTSLVRDGANLFADNGSTTISNSLIADPRGGGRNCQIISGATSTSGGFNDDYSPTAPSCFAAPQATDLTSNPLLAGGLANNGGPTQTLALQPSSPVIDKGSSGGVTDATHDQRAFTRPVEFSGTPNAAGGDGTDIGAFEVQLACAGQVTPSTSCSPPSPPAQPTTPSKKKKCKKKGKKASAAKKKCKKKKK
jgi:hypothetical protein